MAWIAPSQPHAEAKQASGGTVGFFECRGTDLELVAGVAWDHQMSLLRMHLPLSCEVPCGTWRHDVLDVA